MPVCVFFPSFFCNFERILFIIKKYLFFEINNIVPPCILIICKFEKNFYNTLAVDVTSSDIINLKQPRV